MNVESNHDIEEDDMAVVMATGYYASGYAWQGNIQERTRRGATWQHSSIANYVSLAQHRDRSEPETLFMFDQSVDSSTADGEFDEFTCFGRTHNDCEIFREWEHTCGNGEVYDHELAVQFTTRTHTQTDGELYTEFYIHYNAFYHDYDYSHCYTVHLFNFPGKLPVGTGLHFWTRRMGKHHAGVFGLDNFDALFSGVVVVNGIPTARFDGKLIGDTSDAIHTRSFMEHRVGNLSSSGPFSIRSTRNGNCYHNVGRLGDSIRLLETRRRIDSGELTPP